jgi:hypothetical protein
VEFLAWLAVGPGRESLALTSVIQATLDAVHAPEDVSD